MVYSVNHPLVPRWRSAAPDQLALFERNSGFALEAAAGFGNAAWWQPKTAPPGTVTRWAHFPQMRNMVLVDWPINLGDFWGFCMFLCTGQYSSTMVRIWGKCAHSAKKFLSLGLCSCWLPHFFTGEFIQIRDLLVITYASGLGQWGSFRSSVVAIMKNGRWLQDEYVAVQRLQSFCEAQIGSNWVTESEIAFPFPPIFP